VDAVADLINKPHETTLAAMRKCVEQHAERKPDPEAAHRSYFAGAIRNAIEDQADAHKARIAEASRATDLGTWNGSDLAHLRSIVRKASDAKAKAIGFGSVEQAIPRALLAAALSRLPGAAMCELGTKGLAFTWTTPTRGYMLLTASRHDDAVTLAIARPQLGPVPKAPIDWMSDDPTPLATIAQPSHYTVRVLPRPAMVG
jgi:hypothetical protein